MYVYFTQSILRHTGKDTSLDDSSGVTHGVVLKLTEGLELDNYYTSPTLFTSLLQLGFGACGTVRINRRCEAQGGHGSKAEEGRDDQQ